jgi:uncharacterized protein (UPF0332 family)
LDEAEFQTICSDEGRLKPIASLTDRIRYADDFRRLAETKLEAARVLLEHGPEQMAVGEGYFAMEHKANELLALAGYRSKSHVCTCAAMSRLLREKDLARALSLAYRDRQTFDYVADAEVLQSASSVGEFLDVVEAFLAEVEARVTALRAKLPT